GCHCPSFTPLCSFCGSFTSVMNKLLQMGSFKRVTLYDYQALCWVYSESSDSGHTLLDVRVP
uniref:Uncharacterized protein n=1 Tax=Oryzias sinensis TaxID=183150 RepID=A0A8C7Z466_9TELE